jgi:hypothetical protein
MPKTPDLSIGELTIKLAHGVAKDFNLPIDKCLECVMRHVFTASMFSGQKGSRAAKDPNAPKKRLGTLCAHWCIYYGNLDRLEDEIDEEFPDETDIEKKTHLKEKMKELECSYDKQTKIQMENFCWANKDEVTSTIKTEMENGDYHQGKKLTYLVNRRLFEMWSELTEEDLAKISTTMDSSEFPQQVSATTEMLSTATTTKCSDVNDNTVTTIKKTPSPSNFLDDAYWFFHFKNCKDHTDDQIMEMWGDLSQKEPLPNGYAEHLKEQKAAISAVVQRSDVPKHDKRSMVSKKCVEVWLNMPKEEKIGYEQLAAYNLEKGASAPPRRVFSSTLV